jgi:hypothetical protein
LVRLHHITCIKEDLLLICRPINSMVNILLDPTIPHTGNILIPSIKTIHPLHTLPIIKTTDHLELHHLVLCIILALKISHRWKEGIMFILVNLVQ